MLKRGVRLPESVSQYWATHRIWDRWEIEAFETKNRTEHIRQRKLTIDAIKDIASPGLRVLDMCCGTGRVAYDLLSLPNVCEVLAIDINERALSLLTKRLSNHPAKSKLRILNLDIMSEGAIASLGKYDVVICLDSLHHLWNLRIALSRISQLLKSNGVFIGNYLTAENMPDHAIAKKGRIKHLQDKILTRVFIFLGFFDWLWDFSGKSGIVRISWLEKNRLISLLNNEYAIVKSVYSDYFWFVARPKP